MLTASPIAVIAVGAAVAHLTDDRRPDMDADADAQRLIDLAAQRPIELFEPLGHQPGGGERLSAGGSGPLSIPNSAITPSPMNLSTRPPAASTARPIAAK